MKHGNKKVLTTVLSIAMAFVMVAGVLEVVGMLGGPAVTAQVLGSDGGYTPTPTPTPTPTKSANRISVKGKTVSLSAAKLAKQKITISRSKALSVDNADGGVSSYVKVSGHKKITVNKSNGTITVKKGLKKGTYKVKIKVTAKGNSSYKSGSDTATVKIKVSKADNTLKASGKTINIDPTELADAGKEIPITDAVSVSKAQGKVTYSVTSEYEGITYDSEAGNIIVASGTAEGTYTITVKVTAAGNSGYKKGSKTVTVTINVAASQEAAA